MCGATTRTAPRSTASSTQPTRARPTTSAGVAAHEAFLAIAKDDFNRLHALLINDAEMQMIKLPAGKIKTVQTAQAGVKTKFADVVKEAKLASVKFDGVETAIPQCDTTTDVEV